MKHAIRIKSEACDLLLLAARIHRACAQSEWWSDGQTLRASLEARMRQENGSNSGAASGDGTRHGWSCIRVKRGTAEEDESRPTLPPGVDLLLAVPVRDGWWYLFTDH